MEVLTHLIEGFGYIAGWIPMLAIVTGVIFGILAGAMPGLSPSMGVALLVPFTYALDPSVALILLISIYIAANYGGSITAVTINAPGTASAVVTSFDGYPLTKKGKPGVALGISLIASTVGGIVGTLILIFFSVPLAKVTLQFHPAEYFALAFFGLTTVASLGGKNWIKAFTAVFLGLLLRTIGTEQTGVTRYSFGITELFDGFNLIPILIGLFALSEVFRQFEAHEFEVQRFESGKTHWPSIAEYWRLKWTILRSSIIGTVIGIFPGAGATIASFISYDVSKRMSKHPDEFGNGCPDGVAAAEASNSSSVGGALVPLLTLGIPGSASTAVLIGALMIHDLDPGPRLFETAPEIVYGLFASLLIANFVLLALGLLGSKLWIKVTQVPREVLFPLIFAVSIIGAFAVNNSLFDVITCLAFGILGWLMRRYDFPVAPVVLGIVLGRIAEENFRNAVKMGGYQIFFTRPVSVAILCVAVLSIAIPIIRGLLQKKTPEKNQ